MREALLNSWHANTGTLQARPSASASRRAAGEQGRSLPAALSCLCPACIWEPNSAAVPYQIRFTKNRGGAARSQLHHKGGQPGEHRWKDEQHGVVSEVFREQAGGERE